MELPVGNLFHKAWTKKSRSQRTLLESNVKDEIKHDLALGFIVVHGSDPIAEMEAIRLRDAWIQHLTHYTQSSCGRASYILCSIAYVSLSW